jgi:hypothetical protein
MMMTILAAIVLVVGRFERAGVGSASEQPACDRSGISAQVAISTAAAATLTAFALSGFGATTAVGAAALLYLMRRMLIGYR